MVRSLACVLAGVLTATGATASAESYPQLEVNFDLGVQYDHIFEADTGGGEGLSDLYADSEAGMKLRFAPALSLKSAIILEPVRTLTEDRHFDDQGLYVEQLYLNYDGGWFTLYGGKFNPGFGTAWDRTPGLYGTDFAEDYEVTEQLGFGGALALPTEGYGGHRLGAAVFFSDTTPLAASAFTRPRFSDPDVGRVGRLREHHGGPGNTESLESFVVSLDGGAFPALPALTYHLSHIRREAGATELRDEKGYAAGLEFAVPLGEDLSLIPIAEVAWFEDFGGQNQDALYVTAGAELTYGQWSFALSHTQRRLDEPDDGAGPLGADFRDRLTQASIGYEFDSRLGLGAGVKRERAQGVDASFVGLLVTYSFGFKLGGGD